MNYKELRNNQILIREELTAIMTGNGFTFATVAPKIGIACATLWSFVGEGKNVRINTLMKIISYIKSTHK